MRASIYSDSQVWLWPAIAMLYAASAIASESAPAFNVQIGAINYKENGRIDEKLVSVCEPEKRLRESVNNFNTSQQRKREKPQKTAAVVDRRVDIRIDKLAHIGWSGPNNNAAGTELNVTASLPGEGAEQLFICRSNWKSGLVIRPTQCIRVEYCTDTITRSIADWMTAYYRRQTR